MYAVALVRYRRPLDEVMAHVEPHRAYLRELKARGILIASGPIEPRQAGVLLLRVPDDAVLKALDEIRAGDPFIQAGVAQYEMWPWLPNIGREDLDRL